MHRQRNGHGGCGGASVLAFRHVGKGAHLEAFSAVDVKCGCTSMRVEMGTHRLCATKETGAQRPWARDTNGPTDTATVFLG